MKNEIIVRFGIHDFHDITHSEITEILGGIQPDKIYVKGEKRNPNNIDSPLIKKNSWILGSGLSKYSPFEDQMESLLDTIESNIHRFKILCDRYCCEFSCALFVYAGNDESTPWVHLNSRYNELVRKLNVEFDVDLYVFPNEDNAV
ncbi:hypothetical protein DBR11_25910 [Pedobacter sp. HMWF019]|uniref:DUF4279 domain-containing protein n=1 Tax=Pedobacter sp. HMWF019 TaxID=2056856 RepID=UPI000D3A6E54|nr:DUF4279 domain-containing protein [Pedobacter sp. HMWF019]PTS93109.1 hypothetical protein DBR11_25910 [Pedobacter sp. HMWF019]